MCIFLKIWEVITDVQWFGALTQAAAAIISAVAIWFAIVIPRRERAASRSESTHEILRATHLAIGLFESAKAVKFDGPNCLAGHSAKAKMIQSALSVLIQRPELTDGAVITASGAGALMSSIIEQHEENTRRPPGKLARMVANNLTLADDINDLTKMRAKMVIDYACRKKWPSWEKRFRDERRIRELHDGGARLIANQREGWT